MGERHERPTAEHIYKTEKLVCTECRYTWIREGDVNGAGGGRCGMGQDSEQAWTWTLLPVAHSVQTVPDF